MKIILIGLLIVIGLAGVVLAGLWAYVKIVDDHPGPLS